MRVRPTSQRHHTHALLQITFLSVSYVYFMCAVARYACGSWLRCIWHMRVGGGNYCESNFVACTLKLQMYTSTALQHMSTSAPLITLTPPPFCRHLRTPSLFKVRHPFLSTLHFPSFNLSDLEDSFGHSFFWHHLWNNLPALFLPFWSYLIFLVPCRSFTVD